ncbi:MAG: response regulator transcription factor [Vitreoscilla sp.]|nr:response regulator transcription factor [Vitreoscilla sp.]
MPDSTTPLPASIAIVDDDIEYSEFLAQHLRDLGLQVHRFADSNELLTDKAPFSYGFYLVDLMLPGIDGVELIRVLRRRTHAGVLVISGRVAQDVFSSVVDAGADMHLAKPVNFDQVVVAIRAVHRRVVATEAGSKEWLLDRQSGQLVAPDGVRVDLSDGDLVVMECFVEAQGQTVTREVLCRRLGRPVTDEPDNTLSATLYRLRRRIERATPVVVPMQSQSRVGYVFRAPLREA